MIQLNLAAPAIEKYFPKQSGEDNIGIGETRYGERYLLKLSHDVCVAEFVGAALCRACGIPVSEPSEVNFKDKPVFGSRLESGVVLPKNMADVVGLISSCANKEIFSAVLALDLALGNNDRHWHNWLPQPQEDGRTFLRAVDFSRAWPTIHPPMEFEKMRGSHTANIRRLWSVLGVNFDLTAAKDVCDKIKILDGMWLSDFFSQLPVDWMASVDGPMLCEWWEREWAKRVQDVMKFIEKGAWT